MSDIALRFLSILIISSTLLLSFIGGYNYAMYDNSLTKMPIAMRIATNLNAESGYNIHVWDCSNMTEELIIRLKQQGYEAEYAKVKYNNSCHAMVQYTQYIEATTGNFVNPHINLNYSFNRTGCRYE